LTKAYFFELKRDGTIDEHFEMLVYSKATTIVLAASFSQKFSYLLVDAGTFAHYGISG